MFSELVRPALLPLVGIPYAWGGGEPSTPWGHSSPGLDCSGLAQMALVRQGKLDPSAVDRTAASLCLAGERVPREKLVAGDLVFYGREGRWHHVDVYIGGGYVLGAIGGGSRTHGDDPSARVQIRPLGYMSPSAFCTYPVVGAGALRLVWPLLSPDVRNDIIKVVDDRLAASLIGYLRGARRPFFGAE